MKPAQNPYDVVAYPGQSYPSTHPSQLAAMAVLHGLRPGAVEGSRVLEIACGDGANLIPMAYAIPAGEFVGFDLAQVPIERGQKRIRELGLANVQLFQSDLLDAGGELGRFDFIVAHGIYAWTPEPVRDRLLKLCGELLTEDGVAFVSYNALPGGYLRLLVRDAMRFRTGGIDDPQEQVAEGLRFAHFLREARPQGGVYRAILENQLQRMDGRGNAVTLHDEMAEVYHPVYFSDFVQHAGRHGLQYLCDAELPPPPDPCYREEIQSALEQAAGGDFEQKEQLLDFVRMCGYRETLLCKSDRKVQRTLTVEPLRRLRLASQTMAVPGEAPGVTAFVLPGGIRMQSNHPGVTALLTKLSNAWPHALGFEELEPVLVGSGLTLDARGVGLLMRLAVSKMIELRTWNAPIALAVMKHPRASACSRQEAHCGLRNATSLLHKTVSLEDAKVRLLLELLDGTRDRSALLKAMQAGFPDTPPGELEAGLDPSLRLFYATGVLEA